MVTSTDGIPGATTSHAASTVKISSSASQESQPRNWSQPNPDTFWKLVHKQVDMIQFYSIPKAENLPEGFSELTWEVLKTQNWNLKPLMTYLTEGLGAIKTWWYGIAPMAINCIEEIRPIASISYGHRLIYKIIQQNDRLTIASTSHVSQFDGEFVLEPTDGKNGRLHITRNLDVVIGYIEDFLVAENGDPIGGMANNAWFAGVLDPHSVHWVGVLGGHMNLNRGTFLARSRGNGDGESEICFKFQIQPHSYRRYCFKDQESSLEGSTMLNAKELRDSLDENTDWETEFPGVQSNAQTFEGDSYQITLNKMTIDFGNEEVKFFGHHLKGAVAKKNPYEMTIHHGGQVCILGIISPGGRMHTPAKLLGMGKFKWTFSDWGCTKCVWSDAPWGCDSSDLANTKPEFEFGESSAAGFGQFSADKLNYHSLGNAFVGIIWLDRQKILNEGNLATIHLYLFGKKDKDQSSIQGYWFKFVEGQASTMGGILIARKKTFYYENCPDSEYSNIIFLMKSHEGAFIWKTEIIDADGAILQNPDYQTPNIAIGKSQNGTSELGRALTDIKSLEELTPAKELFELYNNDEQVFVDLTTPGEDLTVCHSYLFSFIY